MRMTLWLVLAAGLWAQSDGAMTVTPHKVSVNTRDGVFYVTAAGDTEDQLAIVQSSAGFRNGTIELELSGAPGAGAPRRRAWLCGRGVPHRPGGDAL